MSSGNSSTNTADLWKNPDAKVIYRAAHKATSVFAKALVKQSGVIDAAPRSSSSSASDKGLVILDQACGTGAVAEALHDTLGARPDWHLKCTDLSPPMLEAMEELATSRNWTNVDVAKSDILDNGLDAQSFDYVFASFGTYHRGILHVFGLRGRKHHWI
jgi:SAM-dependent methyltransferase